MRLVRAAAIRPTTALEAYVTDRNETYPGGVVAIIYAAQVNSKLAAGDIAGAQAAK